MPTGAEPEGEEPILALADDAPEDLAGGAVPAHRLDLARALAGGVVASLAAGDTRGARVALDALRGAAAGAVLAVGGTPGAAASAAALSVVTDSFGMILDAAQEHVLQRQKAWWDRVRERYAGEDLQNKIREKLNAPKSRAAIIESLHSVERAIAPEVVPALAI